MKAAIKTKNLTRRFGSFTAVDNITLEIGTGEIFGFLGANGAGKTTTIRILTGLLAPSGGAAEVAGYDVYKDQEKIKQQIGYMSQLFSLYRDLTVRENIRLFGGIYGLDGQTIRNKSEELVRRLNMQDKVETRVDDLPLGWKQKLAFSVALMHEPQLLFLDEPTSGVDPITRRQFWEQIYETAEQGTTIIVTTHYMDEAEYCDRASIMVDGRLEALGAPDELKEQFKKKTMHEVFVSLVQQTKSGES
jgi:ABC-2 type transport system ATP-binding protein